ncbi:MAG: hypothetical protein ACOVP4_13615 [Bacteriovoracaceae bacterium]
MIELIERINSLNLRGSPIEDKKAIFIAEREAEKSPVLSLLLDDFIHDLKNEKIFSVIKQKKTNIIFGNFSCSYHPYLNIEVCSILDVSPSLIIIEKFKNIRCVIQEEGTEGIKNSQVVAIFPENFKGHKVNENDPVYYFVNKFSDRHLKYTRPFLKDCRFNDFFSSILEVNTCALYKFIANWVHLHELSHRGGVMPIPLYLKEKSGRYSAAMEELRADLRVISFCLSQGTNEAQLTALYVFAERLLAYPLFRNKTNFDSISSVIFWKYLRQTDFFLSPNLNILEQEVNNLIDLLHSCEEKAMKLGTCNERRSYLNDYFEAYIGNLDEQFENYKSFWEIL